MHNILVLCKLILKFLRILRLIIEDPNSTILTCNSDYMPGLVKVYTVGSEGLIIVGGVTVVLEFLFNHTNVPDFDYSVWITGD